MEGWVFVRVSRLTGSTEFDKIWHSCKTSGRTRRLLSFFFKFRADDLAVESYNSITLFQGLKLIPFLY